MWHETRLVIALPYNDHLLPELYASNKNKMDIHIGKMTVEHAKEINLLSEQLGYNLSLDQTIQQIKSVLEQKDHLSLVAIHDNKIIGWIHAFKALRIESKTFVEIGGLVVDEMYRNKSIGKRLVEAIAIWSGKEEIEILRVRCNTKRTDSHMFYKKLNFKETKEQKIFQIKL